MAYEWATWLPEVLRAAGCQVVEHDGWRTRGLSTAKPFTPRAVVWHHDASPPGDSPGVPAWMVAHWGSNSAQLWVDRAGVWTVVGAGRAAHAGKVLPGKPSNSTSLGVETDHTTGEPWPPAQLESLRRGTKAILARLGRGAESLEFHKTICSPPGRKPDPDGLDLATERAAVAGGPTTPPPPVTPPPPPPPPPPPVVDRPDVWLGLLKYGTRDSDSVRRLQATLNAHPLRGGSNLPVTGNYLDGTDREVRLCQQQHGASWGEGAADPPRGSNVGPRQARHLGLDTAYDLRPGVPR